MKDKKQSSDDLCAKFLMIDPKSNIVNRGLALNWSFVLLVFTVGSCSQPTQPEMTVTYDIQFWNDSNIDVNHVRLHDGLQSISCGVLGRNRSAYVHDQHTALSGNPMTLTFVEEKADGTIEEHSVQIPRLTESYDRKTIVIRVLGPQQADIGVDDKSLVSDREQEGYRKKKSEVP